MGVKEVAVLPPVSRALGRKISRGQNSLRLINEYMRDMQIECSDCSAVRTDI